MVKQLGTLSVKHRDRAVVRGASKATPIWAPGNGQNEVSSGNT
jgi:hypothetical protein